MMVTTCSDSDKIPSSDLSVRFVMVTLQSHPYHGQRLEVLSLTADFEDCIYVLLPDGTRSMMPKGWTDYSDLDNLDPSAECNHLLDLNGLCDIVKMIDIMKQEDRFPDTCDAKIDRTNT